LSELSRSANEEKTVSSPYTKPFADYYDMRAEFLIQSVDQELEFFAFVFDSIATIQVKTILDVGCGTGRHYVPLVKSGYKVAGMDQSQSMLDVLREKTSTAGLEAHIARKDMREINFADEFDAIICMNTALQYLLTDEDILLTLKAFYRTLKPGGVVIIDIMNFLFLMGGYKENIVQSYTRDGIVFERAIRHSMDDVPAIWNHHEFGIIEDSGRTITYRELHKFRMLNYNEMQRFLREAGFSDVKCFGEFTAREEVGSQSKRLVFVAVK